LNEKVYENSDSDETSSGDSSSGDEDNTSVHVESSIFGATTTIDDHYVYSFEAIKDVPYKLSWTTSAGAKISVHANRAGNHICTYMEANVKRIRCQEAEMGNWAMETFNFLCPVISCSRCIRSLL
jgi:hypothetical protein